MLFSFPLKLLQYLEEKQINYIDWDNPAVCSRECYEIARKHGKKILIIPGLGWALKLMSKVTGLVNKAFGSLSYDMELSEYRQNYRKVSLAESIRMTEKN